MHGPMHIKFIEFYSFCSDIYHGTVRSNVQKQQDISLYVLQDIHNFLKSFIQLPY